jgi:hypothetical protein
VLLLLLFRSLTLSFSARRAANCAATFKWLAWNSKPPKWGDLATALRRARFTSRARAASAAAFPKMPVRASGDAGGDKGETGDSGGEGDGGDSAVAAAPPLAAAEAVPWTGLVGGRSFAFFMRRGSKDCGSGAATGGKPVPQLLLLLLPRRRLLPLLLL